MEIVAFSTLLRLWPTGAVIWLLLLSLAPDDDASGRRRYRSRRVGWSWEHRDYMAGANCLLLPLFYATEDGVSNPAETKKEA